MKRASAVIVLMLLTSCEPTPVQQPPISPSINTSKLDQFNMKKVCFEAGRRLYETEFKNPGGGQSPLNPLYAYSEKLNTCVIYTGLIGKDQFSVYLIDVLSNAEIASSIRTGKQTFGLSREEFDRKKKEFFPDAP